MHYVYILKSINNPDQTYVGCSGDLKKRLSNHNSGVVPHTSKFKPWELVAYIGFNDENKAYDFEKFLKSGSGREFKKRRFL